MVYCSSLCQVSYRIWECCGWIGNVPAGRDTNPHLRTLPGHVISRTPGAHSSLGVKGMGGFPLPSHIAYRQHVCQRTMAASVNGSVLCFFTPSKAVSEACLQGYYCTPVKTLLFRAFQMGVCVTYFPSFRTAMVPGMHIAERSKLLNCGVLFLFP